MIHASSSQPVLPTSRAISPATMKIPDPIIDPATIIVESKRPRLRFSSRGFPVTCFAIVSSSDVVKRSHRPGRRYFSVAALAVNQRRSEFQKTLALRLARLMNVSRATLESTTGGSFGR